MPKKKDDSLEELLPPIDVGEQPIRKTHWGVILLVAIIGAIGTIIAAKPKFRTLKIE